MLKTKTTSLSLFIVFSAALLFLTPSPSSALDLSNTEFDLDFLNQLLEGDVKRFNSENQTVILQMKNGDRMAILLDRNTSFIGYDSAKEIEKGNKIKIWHSTASGTPTALKIEKKLIVGC